MHAPQSRRLLCLLISSGVEKRRQETHADPLHVVGTGSAGGQHRGDWRARVQQCDPDQGTGAARSRLPSADHRFRPQHKMRWEHPGAARSVPYPSAHSLAAHHGCSSGRSDRCLVLTGARARSIIRGIKIRGDQPALAWDDDNLRPKGAHGSQLFGRERVGRAARNRYPLPHRRMPATSRCCRRYTRQLSFPGVALPWLLLPRSARKPSVLVGASRIGSLQLDPHFRSTLRNHFAESYERSIPDRIER